MVTCSRGTHFPASVKKKKKTLLIQGCEDSVSSHQLMHATQRWCFFSSHVSPRLLSSWLLLSAVMQSVNTTLCAFPLTCRKAWLFGRSHNWNILMLFHASCGHLCCGSRLSVHTATLHIFHSAWQCPNFKYVSCCKQHSLFFPSALWILHLISSSSWVSFFGGNFIAMPQSFMMGMFSSILAEVRPETLLIDDT